MEVIEERPRIRSANDWIREAKKQPISRALCGEFWREGETAVLAAEAGRGASALGMQLAELIAGGKSFEFMQKPAREQGRNTQAAKRENHPVSPKQLRKKGNLLQKPARSKGETPGPQRVLYLDLEMNEKQFEARYAADHEGGRARFLHKHYLFSDNLCREERDPADFWVRGERTCDVFCREVRRLVKESGAKVVIIDSITSLKRFYYGSRETLDVMRGLKRLRREMKISILVLVQTPKRPSSQPLSTASLEGLRILCGAADSVFGIGQSRFSPGERYVKRIKALGDSIDFDAMHVPVFRLTKIGGNFLGFEFDRFAPEIELLSDIRASEQWETIELIKQLNDTGKSIREIAAEISLPKTSVHRLLQMWRPPLDDGRDTGLGECFEGGNTTSRECVPFDSDDDERNDEHVPSYDFPGREAYREAAGQAMENEMHASDAREAAWFARQHYLIDSACADARKAYLRTGKAPLLEEDEKYAEFVRAAGTRAPCPPFPQSQAVAQPGIDAADEAADDRSEGTDARVPTEKDTGRLAACGPTTDLKHQLDAYGRDMWIEKEDQRGKPLRWYFYDSNGRWCKKVRTPNGIEIERSK